MAPVVTRQIEASDLAWPHQKAAERMEAASPATQVWMGFRRVGRCVTDACRSEDPNKVCRDPLKIELRRMQHRGGALRHPDYVGEILQNLKVDQPVDVTLKAGYPIIVSAINAETSEPVTDATVSISGSPRGINVTDAPSNTETHASKNPTPLSSHTKTKSQNRIRKSFFESVIDLFQDRR